MPIGRDSPSNCLPLHSDRYASAAGSRSDLFSPSPHHNSRVTPETIRDGTVATRIRSLNGTAAAGFTSPLSVSVSPRIHIQHPSGPRLQHLDEALNNPAPWIYPRTLRPAGHVRPSDLQAARPKRTARMTPFARRDSTSSHGDAPHVSCKSPSLAMQFPTPRRLVSASALAYSESAGSAGEDVGGVFGVNDAAETIRLSDDQRAQSDDAEEDKIARIDMAVEHRRDQEHAESSTCQCTKPEPDRGIARTDTEDSRRLPEYQSLTSPVLNFIRRRFTASATKTSTDNPAHPETEHRTKCLNCGREIRTQQKLNLDQETVTKTSGVSEAPSSGYEADLRILKSSASRKGTHRQSTTPLENSNDVGTPLRRHSSLASVKVAGGWDAVDTHEDRSDVAENSYLRKMASMSSFMHQPHNYQTPPAVSTSRASPAVSSNTRRSTTQAVNPADTAAGSNSTIASAVAIRFGDWIDAVIISHKIDIGAVVSNLDISSPDVAQIEKLSRDLMQAAANAAREASSNAHTRDAPPPQAAASSQGYSHTSPAPNTYPAYTDHAHLGEDSHPFRNHFDASGPPDKQVKSVPALLHLIDATAKDIGLDLSATTVAQEAAAREVVPRALFVRRPGSVPLSPLMIE